MARLGLEVWVYSIAPFCYARPFEQIRNDVCLHRLPVKIVGNGGGYGYGVMGATHHALEDYGTLLGLPAIRAMIPAFEGDVRPLIDRMATLHDPSYLRLGRSELADESEIPPYAPWRRLGRGPGPIVLGVGPVVGGLWAATRGLPLENRPEIWVLSELPLELHPVPEAVLRGIGAGRPVLVVEEHVAQGGFGQMMARELLSCGVSPRRFEHVFAAGYPSGRYGSQEFHRGECGLDRTSLVDRVLELGAA